MSRGDRVPGRRVRLSLLVSGMRWRARSSIAMFAVAVLGVGIGAFGPIYLHGTDQVVLDGTLGGASPGNAGLTLVPTAGRGYPGPLLERARAAPRPAPGARWFGKPIVSQFAGIAPILSVPGVQTAAHEARTAAHETRTTRYRRPGPQPYLGSLVSRTAECDHLRIVAGTCVHGHGVLVSTRTAKLLGLRVGGQLPFTFTHTDRAASLEVVGIYAPGNPTAPYWWGQNFFPFGTEPSSAAGQAYQLFIDDVFAAPSTLRQDVPRGHLSSMVQLPFVERSLSVGSAGGFEVSLSAYQQASLGLGVRVGTKLPALLAQAGSVEHTATTIVAVVDLELVLLALAVLYFVASRTAAEREPDVRLAELRGFRPRTTVGVALAEPVAAVAVAVPVGFLLAWVATAAIAPSVLGPGIGAPPNLLAAYAALAAGAVGIVAAALGTRKALVAGIAPSGSTAAGGAGWPMAGAVTVVVLAVAAFFELAAVGDAGAGSSYDPLAAFAPGLLALALGVLASRLLPLVLRATHRRTAGSPKVALVLATRVVARRAEFGTQLVLVTIAVALASFAVSGWAIANRNHQVRAQFGVGAAKVLTVAVRPGATFLAAVRAADPSGRDAMAAVVEQAPDGTTLAVDARRLPEVANWPPEMGLSIDQVARRLVPRHLGRTVVVPAATGLGVTIDAVSDATPPPNLTVDLFDVGTQTPEQVTLGALQSGNHTYRGSLSFLCPGGCRLEDLALTWTPTPSARRAGSAPVVALRVLGVSERPAHGPWRPVRAGLTGARGWTSRSGGVTLAPAGGGLAARARLDFYGAPVTFGPADTPKALPVLVTATSASQASGDGGPLVVGLDGATVPGHTVGQVPALPGIGPRATLADLHTAELFQSGPMINADTEVWLAPHAPAGIVRALRAHGVTVLATETAAAQEQALTHAGVTLAYLMYLMSAVAAGVLVVGATAFAVGSGARRRQTELAALRTVGVPSRRLRRALLVEQAIVLGSGLVVGAVAGLVAAAVALRSVPEFVVHVAGPPLELGLPPAVLAAALGALVVALAGTITLGATAVARGVSVERLGSGPG